MRVMTDSLDRLGLVTLLMMTFAFVGCGTRTSRQDGGAEKAVIRVEGSDTMVNLAQAWAEAYNKLHPEVSVQVSGGGSGVGIASLIEGVVDMANASRSMQAKEIQRAKATLGQEPKEHTVALDALAVYVHKNNPLETISLQELAEIYGRRRDDHEMGPTQGAEHGLWKRRDHACRPPEQLGDLPLFSRGRDGRLSRF